MCYLKVKRTVWPERKTSFKLLQVKGFLKKLVGYNKHVHILDY